MLRTSPHFASVSAQGQYNTDHGYDEAYEKRMGTFEGLMAMVYGTHSSDSKKTWHPKPYADNKSRYLWTDAFGVCNFITLYYENGGKPNALRKGASRGNYLSYLDQADALINDVHSVLGKTRDGKRRLGDSTDEHPLRGGLRIGKEDEEGTMDGDGQYFHYLTKWMFALNRMSVARNDPKYNNLAIELAEAVHDKFVHKRLGEPRMYWKMSIDLAYPAVPSEGNLDPYDGYVMYKLLQQTAKREVLQRQVEELRGMIQKRYMNYRSSDLLDLGETLWLTHFFPKEEWSVVLTERALTALKALTKYREKLTKDKRLLFRECGTIMGLQSHPRETNAEPLFKNWVEQFQVNSGYNERLCDRDITPVMICTCLNLGVFKNDYLAQ